jgi:hypothetical protein
MQQKPVVFLILAGILGAVPAIASAQTTSRFYAGATFGSIDVSADDVDGTSPAAGAIVGFEALPWLDVEAEFSKPSDPFTRSYGGDTLSLAFGMAGATREELERAGIWLRYDQRREINLTFSTVAIFRPPVRGRVVPGFIVGMTNHRVQHRTDYTPVRVGPDVDPSNMYARPHAETGTRNIGALTVGANVIVMITRHFGVVPDLRYDYGSIGDVKENSLRPSVRVLWRF